MTEEEQNETEDRREEESDEEIRERLQEEVEELESQLKRVMADFDNYRKRMAKERRAVMERASESLMFDLLDVMDDFDRALSSDGDPEPDGIEMIKRKFYNILTSHGLKEIDSEGKEFDPLYHECLVAEEVEDEDKENVVLEEIKKGYKLNSKVIRPAKVKVGEYCEDVDDEEKNEDEDQEVKEDE